MTHPLLLGKREISIATLVTTVSKKKRNFCQTNQMLQSLRTMSSHGHGHHNPKQVPSTTEQATSKKKSRPKLSLQGTQKIGCNAGIHIREYTL